MTLYDKPVRTLMWGMVADLKLAKGDVRMGRMTARPPTGRGRSSSRALSAGCAGRGHGRPGRSRLLGAGVEPGDLLRDPLEDKPRVPAEMEKERHELHGRLEVLRARDEDAQHGAPEVPCGPAPEPEPPDHGPQGGDLRPAPPRGSELLGLSPEPPGEGQHAAAIALREVQAAQDRRVVREDLDGRTRRGEIEAPRGLIRVARPLNRVVLG